MFGKKNNSSAESPRSNTSSSGLAHNSIVQGTYIEGTVKSTNDFRIDGEFNGNLYCENKVIIGKNGFFDGNINCGSAVIEGKFLGQMDVEDVLIVKDSAIVKGEISTLNLSVEPGSVFQVTCKMKGEQEVEHEQSTIVEEQEEISQ